MIVKYKVEGTIEVDLNEYEIQELNTHKSETMKKSYLEQLLTEKLHTCSMTAEHECNDIVNFENLFITKDWKYSGNIQNNNLKQYVSPLAISIEDLPTTLKEISDNTMNEIAERKQRYSKKWK